MCLHKFQKSVSSSSTPLETHKKHTMRKFSYVDTVSLGSPVQQPLFNPHVPLNFRLKHIKCKRNMNKRKSYQLTCSGFGSSPAGGVCDSAMPPSSCTTSSTASSALSSFSTAAPMASRAISSRSPPPLPSTAAATASTASCGCERLEQVSGRGSRNPIGFKVEGWGWNQGVQAGGEL